MQLHFSVPSISGNISLSEKLSFKHVCLIIGWRIKLNNTTLEVLKGRGFFSLCDWMCEGCVSLIQVIKWCEALIRVVSQRVLKRIMLLFRKSCEDLYSDMTCDNVLQYNQRGFLEFPWINEDILRSEETYSWLSTWLCILCVCDFVLLCTWL